MPRFVKRTRMPFPAADVFAYHEAADALDRLSPPWAPMRVIQPPSSLAVGTQVILRTGLGPLHSTWVAEHVEYDPPHGFRDVQRSGPFAEWDHRHRVEPLPGGGSVLVDDVTYRLPLGRVGAVVGGPVVRRMLQAMFDYRHRRTLLDLTLRNRTKEIDTLKVAITGASGLTGSALTSQLRNAGHGVVRLVRSAPQAADEVRWDPAAGTVDTDGLRGVDAVVHLAAAGLLPRRMSAAEQAEFRRSRVEGTRTIAQALAGMTGGPRILLSASGTNYYGDRGDEVLTEDSAPGPGWLAEIAHEWEGALQPARDAGLRVVAMRTAVVLDRSATILKVLGTLTRLGLAAPLGSGRQYWSWITLDDAVGLYLHALTHDEIDGVMAVGSPSPVTNAEFTRTLARVLHRPVIPIPVPKAAPRLLLGRDYADSLLFTSLRVQPERALATGYDFLHPNLEQALRAIYGR